MRQRVGLARALAVNADVLLLDEPFSAVDEQTRRKFQEDLLRLREREHKTFIFVTHSIEEAVYLSDQIVMLSRRPGPLSRIVEPKIDRSGTPTRSAAIRATSIPSRRSGRCCASTWSRARCSAQPDLRYPRRACEPQASLEARAAATGASFEARSLRCPRTSGEAEGATAGSGPAMIIHGWRIPMMASLLIWCVLWEIVGRLGLVFLLPPFTARAGAHRRARRQKPRSGARRRSPCGPSPSAWPSRSSSACRSAS